MVGKNNNQIVCLNYQYVIIFRNKRGYQVFRDSDGVVRSVHKRVLKKKLGRLVRRGFDADHINRNKNDN